MYSGVASTQQAPNYDAAPCAFHSACRLPYPSVTAQSSTAAKSMYLLRPEPKDTWAWGILDAQPSVCQGQGCLPINPAQQHHDYSPIWLKPIQSSTSIAFLVVFSTTCRTQAWGALLVCCRTVPIFCVSISSRFPSCMHLRCAHKCMHVQPQCL